MVCISWWISGNFLFPWKFRGFPQFPPTTTSVWTTFEVQLFDEQGDKQDRFQTKPADKAVSWKNCWRCWRWGGWRWWRRLDKAHLKECEWRTLEHEGSDDRYRWTKTYEASIVYCMIFSLIAWLFTWCNIVYRNCPCHFTCLLFWRGRCEK